MPGERSDADLLAAHAAGDRDAFAQLYFRHHRRLRRLAVNLVRDPEDAADALQEAMLSAHRGAATFRQQAAVGSWLHRIVLNACLDRLRHNRTHSTEVLDERMCAVPDRTGRSDTRISVHRALMTLPAEQRSAASDDAMLKQLVQSMPVTSGAPALDTSAWDAMQARDPQSGR